MLAKANRLTKKQFDEYFTSGKRFHFPICTIVYIPHSSLHASVVVGKKVAKRAVERNRYRRRVYDQLRRALVPAGVTGVYIVLLKPTWRQLTRQQALTAIQDVIATVLKKT